MSKFIPLLLILAVASILRLWNLSGNPPGLTWDEASLGYNAYSILQTGRDEYGTFIPLNLKSFGDYKPALYAYIDIPFVAILGLNELAVRLPTAIFGILSVLLIFFLTQELFKNKYLSLFSAFFLAISPLHIQFSRPAYEASFALFLNLLAAYFFVKGLQRNRLFIFSAIAFGLSLLTYQSSRLFVPMLVIVLYGVFRQKVTFEKYFKVSSAIFSIFLLIFVTTIIFQGQGKRLSTLNFFAYQRSEEEINLVSKEDNLDKNSLTFQILHGEWWTYAKGLLERYFIYFSPKTLFIEGDYNQRHRVSDLGILYYFSIIFIPMGLIYLLKLGNSQSKFVLLWLLIAPIPAVLSRDLISSYRGLNLLFPITLLEAAGCWWLISKLKTYRFGILGVFLVGFIITFNFFIYLDKYFLHAPKEYSKYWMSGYKRAFDNLKEGMGRYDKIVISDHWGQPYIYYLFYTKYPPASFQKQAILDQPGVDVGTVRKIDNIEFRSIFWPNDRGEKNALFIGTTEELPEQDIKNFNELDEYIFLNGEIAFRVVETKP